MQMEYQFESLGPTVRIVVLIFLIVFALIALGVVVLIAALPGQIARSRHHPQADAINVCGWLGLPTGILWVVAMVWAFLRTNPSGSTQANASSAIQALGRKSLHWSKPLPLWSRVPTRSNNDPCHSQLHLCRVPVSHAQ